MLLTQTLAALTIAIWLIFGLIIFFSLLFKARRDGFWATLWALVHWRTILLLLLAFSLTLLTRSLVFIQPQEVGVVVSLINSNGYRDRPLRSGLHWLAPLMEQVHRYPIAWQTYTMARTPTEGAVAGDDAVTARSADGQEVAIDCSVIYQLTPEQAVRIHIEWQARYQDDFIRAVTRGVVRSVASNYTAEEINSDKRQDLEQQINDTLRETFRDKGFTLDRFVLRNIAFSPEFAAAIEAKQVEQEGVLRSQYQAEQVRQVAQGQADQVRIQAQADAEAIRLRAEAEAEALVLIAESLSGNPDLLSYRYIEKLSPNIRVMLLPNDSPYVLPLNDMNLADLPPATPPISATQPLTNSLAPTE